MFVRPGTRAAIAPQFLPFVCTAPFSLMFSSSDYFPGRKYCIRGILPSAPTLLFRSTRDQRGDYNRILATVRLYRMLQLDVFVFCPPTRPWRGRVDVVIQGTMLPSSATLLSPTTRNQRGDCNPIHATERINCILQLSVFVCYPCTRTFIRLVDVGNQGIIPSAPIL
jgi:hypothetical protein